MGHVKRFLKIIQFLPRHLHETLPRLHGPFRGTPNIQRFGRSPQARGSIDEFMEPDSHSDKPFHGFGTKSKNTCVGRALQKLLFHNNFWQKLLFRWKHKAEAVSPWWNQHMTDTFITPFDSFGSKSFPIGGRLSCRRDIPITIIQKLEKAQEIVVLQPGHFSAQLLARVWQGQCWLMLAHLAVMKLIGNFQCLKLLGLPMTLVF